MGTIVQFKDKSFQASDGLLEIWLHLLVQQIERVHQPPHWLSEAKDEWQLQSTAAFGFGVTPDLDGFITDEERRNVVRSLCESALIALNQYGDLVDAQILNQMNLGSYFAKSLSTESIKQIGRDFISLFVE